MRNTPWKWPRDLCVSCLTVSAFSRTGIKIQWERFSRLLSVVELNRGSLRAFVFTVQINVISTNTYLSIWELCCEIAESSFLVEAPVYHRNSASPVCTRLRLSHIGIFRPASSISTCVDGSSHVCACSVRATTQKQKQNGVSEPRSHTRSFLIARRNVERTNDTKRASRPDFN